MKLSPCPMCNSQWLRRRQRTGMLHCRNCGYDYKNEVNGAPVKRVAHSGSGVIAGRITVGKGSVYGAGW